MRKAITLASIMLFLGCSGQKKFEATLDSWVGADVNRLIQSWGPPTRSYKMPNGHTVYTWAWDSHGAMAVPLYGGGVIAQSLDYSCIKDFEADENDRIVSWHYSGNRCY